MPAPVNPAIRLLSPEKRRIYPNAKTGVGVMPGASSKVEDHCTLRQREGLKAGQPDDKTWDALVVGGWTVYEGEAECDERGYVLIASDGNAVGDSSVSPNPWPDPKRQGRAR